MSEYRLAEKPALDVLIAMGYVALHHEAAMVMRQEANRVLLKPVLIEALQALNEGLGAEDAEAIYSDLSILSDNEEWQRRLRGAYSRRLKGEAKDKPVVLIDFKRPDRNRYHVVRQFKVEAQRSRIADLVVFVNGIPLVVIEAKCPLKAADRSGQAFEQIKQYERDIPRLFYPNAFNIVTDGMATLYGATGAPAKFYAPWPDPWPRSRDEFADDLTKDLWCLLEPSRLLDLLAHFIVFETDPDTGRRIKKVCRYQQFRAVNKAVNRVAEGTKKKGLIWHTQGSGKSLTMVFLALKLKTHLTLDAPTLQNPNILVLTDRIDLDDQISKTFVACGLPNPKQAADVKALREAVARGGSGQILLSTIFKFQGSKKPIPNSEDWIVLVSSYRADDVQNALRDLDLLRRDLRKTHAEFMRQRRLLGLDGMEEKSAAYAVEKLVADGREDDWFELQRLCRHFVRTYGDLSPDPAILDFTEDMKWAATFLRLAQQAITKDESLDHLTYSGKIRDMLEEHVRATGLTTTVRLRNITDPDFKEDFQTEEMSDEELHAAFVRKSVELKRVTRELVDKNPAQYGRFSERVLEIIRRFEEGQIAAAEGLKDFEDLTGGIATEAGAHDELGMDERAFAMEKR